MESLGRVQNTPGRWEYPAGGPQQLTSIGSFRFRFDLKRLLISLISRRVASPLTRRNRKRVLIVSTIATRSPGAIRFELTRLEEYRQPNDRRATIPGLGW